MKAAEDFFTSVHIIAAAKTVNNCSEVSYRSLAEEIVEKFVSISLFDDEESHIESTDESTDELEVEEDGIYAYGCEVLTLGLLWHCFHDAIKEGDGDRVMLVWKFLLIVFKLTNRRNYSQEAAMLLIQQQYLLLPHKAAQLTWSSFVNTSGRRGCNIPCDLHMEHFNRRLKDMIKHLGSNVKPHIIQRAGKCVGLIHYICKFCTFAFDANQGTQLAL